MRIGQVLDAAATWSQTRRLAAILAADVASYSRLMREDEEGTLAALKAIRRGLADPKIKEHRGRIVKTIGDGLLLEFASVADAVRCAVEVQREMAERTADVPPDRRIGGATVPDCRTGPSRRATTADESTLFQWLAVALWVPTDKNSVPTDSGAFRSQFAVAKSLMLAPVTRRMSA